MKPITLLILGTILIVLDLQVTGSALTVNTQSWGDPNITTFPPGSPPPGMQGDADENPEVNVWGTFKAVRTGKNTAKAVNVVVDANGRTHIRMPADADPNLRAHEDGHDRVNESEYNRKAKKKIEEAFRGFEEPRTFPPGTTPEQMLEAIQKDFNERRNKAAKAIIDQMDEAGKRYDAPDLTDGGHNTAMAPEEAAKKVEEESEKAEKKKEQHNNKETPTSEEEAKKAIGGTDAKKKQQDEQKIVFEPNTVPVNATDSADTINGRGTIELGEITPLGNDGPGVVYCADSHIRLLDMAEPNGLFFEAGLYAVRIAPATLPGYAQMLQGVLNVWEVDNAIGSDFLAYVQQADEQDKYLSLWFYATEPMVDEDGRWIAAGNVAGQVIITVASDADITMTEDFEDYDPISFASAWLPVGGGMPLLEQGVAYSLWQSMRLLVNNTMPGSYSGATHYYPQLQDFSGLGRSLDIYILRETAPQPPEEDFYVSLRDSVGGYATFSIALAEENDYADIMHSDSQWVGVSIDMRVFEQMIDLAHIEQITLGFLSEIPTAGCVIIDAISVHERRELGPPAGDLDLDSRVTMTDLAVLAEHWCEQQCWPSWN
jgi:hypothetical protein